MSSTPLDPSAYRALASFRHTIRRFLAFSEAAADKCGLTARQHQALLAIKGHTGATGPHIRDLAEALLIQHNTTVELVNRLVEAGLLVRCPDPEDRRAAVLRLTEAAERHLADLSAAHLDELRRIKPALRSILDLMER